MRNRLSACALLAIAALPALAPAESAAADPPAAGVLRWSRRPGAEGCIEEDALARAVLRRLDATRIADRSRSRSVEGHIERATGDSTFRATLTLLGPTGASLGTREVWTSSPSCRTLDADLALVVTLMLDPDAAFASEPSLPADPGPPPASSSPLPASPAAPDPSLDKPSPSEQLPPDTPDFALPDTAPPAPPWSIVARGGPVFSFGFFPSIGTGFALRAAVAPPGVPTLEIGGVYWGEQRVSAGDGTFGANLWIAYGTLAVCPVTGQWREFWGSACAGVEVGVVHAGGYGFSTTVAQLVPIASAAVGAHVRRTISGRIFAGAGLDLSIPFVRPDLYYRKSGVAQDAFTPSPIAGSLELALGVSLQ